MGREIRRVPLDFDHPVGEIWGGFLSPDSLGGLPCPDCENGYSPYAQHLHDLWYGYVPFQPEDNGSTPLTPDTPAVRAFAERNIRQAPDYYGDGEWAIRREAWRLADMWNSMWCYHVNQDDVDALVAGDRLWDLTRVSTSDGWEKIEPPPMVTPERVNEWNIRTFGHDSINAWVVIRARCEREGVSDTCPTCQGHGSIEAYPGQRADAEAWEPTGPLVGDGWQLWETVSEGSPMSPVFETAGELAYWMSDSARGRDWVPANVALKFIEDGWAPSGVVEPGRGYRSGVEWVGMREEES